MFTSKLEAFTFLKGAVVAASVGLGFSQLCTHFSIDPLGHVRTRVESLQVETMPANSRIVYRELTGYFPLAPKMEWRFETESSWEDVQQRIEERFTDFRLHRVNDALLMLASHAAGEVQHLEVELLREDAPTLVRCRYSVSSDVSE